jgi:autonomous glycyl radical cofactor GrcA
MLRMKLLVGKRLRRNVLKEKTPRIKLLGGKGLRNDVLKEKIPRIKLLGGKRLRGNVLVRREAEEECPSWREKLRRSVLG